MVSSKEMITMTTIISMSVKPRPRLPIMIRDSIQSGSRGTRVHVEDIVPGLRIARRARIGAQSPGVGRRRLRIRPEWVARHAPQKIDFHALLRAARVLD